jgi:hypothetical protein
MNFDVPKQDTPEQQNTPKTYAEMLQVELDSGRATDQKEAMKIVELALFNERMGQFIEADLTKDADGSWKTFEDKVRSVFPELTVSGLEDRLTAMKAAVTMELCGY